MPGFRSWIPSSLPSTVARALSGTLGKCRMVPSSILTTKSLPETWTTSPRSTVSSWLACPAVVVLSVCTCALMLRAKARDTTPTASISHTLAHPVFEFIAFSPCVAFTAVDLSPVTLVVLKQLHLLLGCSCRFLPSEFACLWRLGKSELASVAWTM